MYQVIREKRICKDLDKIHNADVERILDVFKELSLNPTPAGSKKLSGKIGLYRIRQGDYRILYTIDHKEETIKIIAVRHRREVYRQI